MSTENCSLTGNSAPGGVSNLLPAVRDIYSRHPEYYHLQAWELQHVLFSLGYEDDLADEDEITAAIEVARADYPWRTGRPYSADPSDKPLETRDNGLMQAKSISREKHDTEAAA